MAQHPSPPDGVLLADAHLYAVRVYYEDTDLSGVAYHANYLRWAERARSDLLRQLGIDQRAAIEDGSGAWAVADLSVRYLAPAKLDDDLVIQTWCTALGAASCRMTQRVSCHGRVLAELALRVGFVAPDGRPRRLPPAWRTAFQPFVTEALA